MISRLAEPQMVCFAHVVETRELPDSVRVEWPELAETPVDALEDQMCAAVDSHFDGDAGSEPGHEVADSSPVHQLLRLASGWSELT